MVAWIIFLSNARFSEEFTGGVKITVGTQLSETVKDDIEQYFTEEGFANSKVSIEVYDDITKLSLKTDVKDDEKVNMLSQDIQDLLVSKQYISDPSMILEQSITGPSIGNYMQKSARSAIIV